MKTLKKMLGGFLAFALILGTAAVSVPVTAQAAANYFKNCPSKLRIYTGYADNYALEDIQLTSAKYYIKSVTSSSKNLKAEVVYESADYDEENGVVNKDSSSYNIGMYAKKEGTYKLKLQVADASTDKVVQTKTVTVYAKNDSPFKKVTVNGKADYDWERYYSTKKKIKFAVTAAKGYTIQKIEIGTCKTVTDENGDTQTDYTYKKVSSKKSASFTLSTKAYTYSYTNEYKSEYSKSVSRYSSWYESMGAPTIVRVTYKDKWTKQPATQSFYFYYIK